MPAAQALKRHKLNKHSRSAAARAEMPAEFRETLRPVETLAPLLQRFQASRSLADRDVIIRWLLPLVMKIASARLPFSRTNSDLDEIVSDGCMDLASMTERYCHLPAQRFIQVMSQGVRYSFYQYFLQRRGGPQTKSEKNKLLYEFRRNFIRKTGQVPTAEDRQAYLATIIINPGMEVRPAPKTAIAFSALGAGEIRESHLEMLADPSNRTADVVNHDLIKFAMKDLHGIDRQLFKRSVIDGCDNKEIRPRWGCIKPQ